jgi:hypothetical protein
VAEVSVLLRRVDQRNQHQRTMQLMQLVGCQGFQCSDGLNRVLPIEVNPDRPGGVTAYR